MIESSIEELFNSINNSNEYKEYKLIVNTLESNKEVIDLIEEIKKLQKEAVNLEYCTIRLTISIMIDRYS